eukprot:TRINITY_DN38131_c0_g1_i1.p2 TRINITY_DN38131_c0_g1~~TRINITY_DN38131_c0_g1_i1.p2  ORF type:complete len:167 (+),score=35.44 TRINITY_DN38131_c0_g1_i1:189-689(+)
MPKYLNLQCQQGVIKILLREDVAPQTCALIQRLTEGGHYGGCGFYRAEKGFCIQAGLRKVDGTVLPNPFGKVPLEYSIPNTRGTVAMARWDDPASGDGEWFINLGTNTNLDRTGDQGWSLGFCAWGEVVEGLSTADAISLLPTRSEGGMSMLQQTYPFTASIEEHA